MNKRQLYESIMSKVAKEVKKALNEEFDNSEFRENSTVYFLGYSNKNDEDDLLIFKGKILKIEQYMGRTLLTIKGENGITSIYHAEDCSYNLKELQSKLNEYYQKRYHESPEEHLSGIDNEVSAIDSPANAIEYDFDNEMPEELQADPEGTIILYWEPFVKGLERNGIEVDRTKGWENYLILPDEYISEEAEWANTGNDEMDDAFSAFTYALIPNGYEYHAFTTDPSGWDDALWKKYGRAYCKFIANDIKNA